MCDRYLHCPYCNRRLVAICDIAGDNATGLYLEFFLVKPTGTEPSGFVPSRVRAASATVVAPGDSTAAAGDAAAITSASASALDAHPGERGFDDDEAPFPQSR